MDTQLNRRSFLTVPLACAAALMISTAVWANGFFASVDDLPLMAGLSEIPEVAIMYDKPGGRIVRVAAKGAVSQQAVAAYYDRTLPQLGWQRYNAGFQRDDEKLSLRYESTSDGLIVHISINPK